MRRRITEAIVGVSALILVVLGVPLALVIHKSILDSEVVELQATAARTLTEIQVPIDRSQLAALSSEPDTPPPFSVYDAAGSLVFGDGPAQADSAVRRALAGDQASTTDGEIVVATPISDDTNERVVGALRLTESLAEPNHRSRVAWLEMAATGLTALALGWLIAERLARRLSQPVTDLAAAAVRMGDGGALARPTKSSGVSEIDTLANALADSSVRINDALARERRFSADVSHQLRTPLTAIRLRLEAARSQHAPDTIESALDDLHRLEQTVDHLLAFARDSIPATSTVRPAETARQAADRWHDRVVAAGRHLTIKTSEPITTRGSVASTEQILDVLIDNALHHGDGDITITQRRIAGGAAIDVCDEGMHIESTDAERIFERGHGDRNGIGLALARSIAEAEGGRLILSRRSPTTFSLILLEPEQNGEP
ncbi:MAG: HAMP domain-containing sensor histidine kinase [Ilumatobacteraceae bacterium]